MAAAAAKREIRGLLRAHRARLRLQSRGDADHCAPGWRFVDPEWREDLDHQRHHVGCVRGLGARRRRRRRLPGGTRDFRLYDVGYSREMVDAGIRHVEPVSGGLPGEGERTPAWRARAESAPLVSLAGALRNRLGRDRGGHGLLRDGGSIPSCGSNSPTGPLPRISSCRKSWPA